MTFVNLAAPFLVGCQLQWRETLIASTPLGNQALINKCGNSFATLGHCMRK